MPVECLAYDFFRILLAPHGERFWRPDTDWSQGGPLIDKFDVEFLRFGEKGFYERDPQWNQKPCIGAVIRLTPGCTYAEIHIEQCMTGDTRLMAGCRAIVAAKFGETVQVPKDLQP